MLKQTRQRGDACRQRFLALWLNLPVVADVREAGMAPRHQHGTGGRANRASRVVLGESNSFLRQAVEVGRAHFLLSIGTELAVPEIVGKNENDVRFGKK